MDTPSRDRYERYISSDNWRSRRESFFIRRGRRCSVCGTHDQLEVHHITYRNFGAEKDEDLVSLCRPHHLALHQYQRRTLIPLEEASRRFLSISGLQRVSPRKRRRRTFRVTAEVRDRQAVQSALAHIKKHGWDEKKASLAMKKINRERGGKGG